jgi:xylulokinase
VPQFAGLDIGTSSTKAVLIDGEGKIVAQAHRPYEVQSPRPLWAEQDPEVWWRATQACLGEIGGDPAAIGLTGQMHGSVFLDSQDRVVRPALLWCDQRTTEDRDALVDRVGRAVVRKTTGNPMLTGFQAPKIAWLRRQEPDAFRRVRTVLLPKDFVRLRLTGEKATDVSDASGVGLFDVASRSWSTALVEAMEFEPDWFPAVFESDEGVGQTTSGTRVVAGAGDQSASAVGTGAVTPDVVSVSLGTSGVVFVTVKDPELPANETVHLFCHAQRGWHRMGVVLSFGGAVSWAQRALFPDLTLDEMADFAALAPAGCEGLTFVPRLAGERCPVDRPDDRGRLMGLTLRHGREHLARAVFEGAAFALAAAWGSALQGLPQPVEVRVTGGGASNAFMTQLLADVLGSPLSLMQSDEGPAVGAALLAGVGSGHWRDAVEASAACVKVRRTIEPTGQEYGGAVERFLSHSDG